jgi:hypothetical protein
VTLSTKITRRLALFFCKLTHYGFAVAFWELLDSQKKRIGAFQDKISEKKHAAIISWLTGAFQYLILNFSNW